MERFSQELLEVIKVCRIQIPQERLTVFCSLKYSKILVPIRNGHKLTKDTFISRLMMGTRFRFCQNFFCSTSHPVSVSQEESKCMTWKYKNTVERRSKTSPTKYKSNSKFSFCTSKADSGPQLVTNLKKFT